MPTYVHIAFPTPPRIPDESRDACLRDLNRAAAENLSNSLNHSRHPGNFETVEAALRHAGYETERADGALEIVGFNRERFWEEEDLFRAIAPHLDGPATVRVESESDDEVWTYEFENGAFTCEVDELEPEDGEDADDDLPGPRA